MTNQFSKGDGVVYAYDTTDGAYVLIGEVERIHTNVLKLKGKTGTIPKYGTAKIQNWESTKSKIKSRVFIKGFLFGAGLILISFTGAIIAILS